MKKGNKGMVWIAIALVLLGMGLIAFTQLFAGSLTAAPTFDATRAFGDVEAQMAFGPRTPGSQAHEDTVKYIQDELQKAGWDVTIQNLTQDGHAVENIIATHGKSSEPVVIGAHYDSRLVADQDPNSLLSTQPVPGADDGASGVAVLLEMARVMPTSVSSNVWLVFFDAEDQGDLPGWDWILGSKAFVSHLDQKIKSAVVVDMVGDKDLNIYREEASDLTLTDQIWNTAAKLGYANQFIDETKYSILDDHLPFIQAGIPAVDIIDIEYAYWHTTADTADKVSPKSLKTVGDTLLAWLSAQ